MANRILVSATESVGQLEWLCKVEPFLQGVLKDLGFDGKELSVMFCGDDEIAELNKNYRNIEGATDVLSFESGDEYTDEDGKKWVNAGDIAISLETLKKNAAYFNTDENSELKRLLVHGVLHLNGYDHGEEHIAPGDVPKCEMLVLQENLLEKLKEEDLFTD